MKKLFTFLFALTLSMGLWAETQTVSYLYPVYNTPDDPTSGIKEWQTDSVDATVVTDSLTKVTWNAGWYVVKGADVKLPKGVVCSGAVHLVLADGAKLTVKIDMFDETPAIQVSGDGNSLTIYAQTAQSGQLIATAGDYGAGIGGGDGQDGSNITINGGKITVTDGSGAACIGGGYDGDGFNITINGGIVDANGFSSGTAIGGGSQGDGSNITINGGIVTANSGNSGAGIGGGWKGNGSNITITGGTVTANASYRGAGIGGGQNGNGTNITISGGTVTANGIDGGAGIGGGYESSGSNITITGGIVTANARDGGAGIGGGLSGSGSNIKVAAPFIIKAFDSKKNLIVDIATNHTDGKDISKDLAGKQYVTITPDPIVAYAEGYAVGKAEAVDAKAAGIEEGKAAILDALPTEEVPGVQLKVTKTVDGQLKQIILMNPDKVEYLQGNPPENHGLTLEN